ncbi:MAG: ferrous iron transport protein A [Cytophagales bacterium]|nr:ferrous iron transport protein A [Cytophaga sp.]
MADPVKTVADLKIGEKGTICGFTDEETSLKLLEMGCLPGCEIVLDRKAPLGDPVCIKVCGYTLSMRLTEASTILLS